MSWVFAATSTGHQDGINNTFGGLCRQNGMILEVYIKSRNVPGQAYKCFASKPEAKPDNFF